VDVSALVPAQTSDEDEAQSEIKDKPAWVDSDDERITVSLASNPRLRKLRITESEDLISGREYTKRLRRQFGRLYPVPEWANPSAAQRSFPRNKRRTSDSSESSEGMGFGDETSLEPGHLSVQPLAKLLQNAGSLIQSTSANPGQKRKLRPEIIDVHRTKDVGIAQPVSFAFFPAEMMANTSSFDQVFRNIACLSSRTPSTLKLRPVFHTKPASYLSTPAQSKPFAHNPSLTLHPPRSIPIPPSFGE